MTQITKSFNTPMSLYNNFLTIFEEDNIFIKSMKEYADSIIGNSKDVAIRAPFSNYEDYINWALYVINTKVQNPFKFSEDYTAGFNANSFSLYFPNGIMICMAVRLYGDKISYDITLSFTMKRPFIINTFTYKEAIKTGWKDSQDPNDVEEIEEEDVYDIDDE